MALQIIPRLPALDTQATLQEYQAVAGASPGMTWPKLLPFAAWKARCPSLAATLPADDWGIIPCSDHSGGTGRWYLETASTILGLTGTPTEIFTGANQNEMPCCFLNPVHEVIEVIPHINFQSEFGFASGQASICYWTTDFDTFNSATVELPNGGYLYDPVDTFFQATSLIPNRPYAPFHNGYMAHYEDRGKSYLLSVMGGAVATAGVHVRNSFTDNWSFLRFDFANHTQLTGDRTKYFNSQDCLVKVQDQWYRLTNLGTHPRLTLTNTIALVAIPIAGPHDPTPLDGYQTLVSPDSGYHLIGSHDAYWDEAAGRLYVTYTERETATGQNRIRVAYNSLPFQSLHDAIPSVYTSPVTPIRENGRIVPEFTATTSYIHDDLSTMPSWLTRTGTGSEAETADGFAMTNTGDTTWHANVSVNPNTDVDVLLVKWTCLRFSDAANPFVQIGVRDDASLTDSEMLVLDDGAGSAGDRRLTNRLSRRGAVSTTEYPVYLYQTNQDDDQQYWHRQGFDLTFAIWASGRKMAIFLDDVCVLYETIAAAIGAVHPFIRPSQAGQTISYRKLEFLAGDYVDESTIAGGGLTYSLT